MICGTLILKKIWNGLAPSIDRRLDGLLGNAAQGGREDHHGEAGLDPDQHDHQEEVVPERDGQPGLRLAIGQRGGEQPRRSPEPTPDHPHRSNIVMTPQDMSPPVHEDWPPLSPHENRTQQSDRCPKPISTAKPASRAPERP
jgi:hypothetical protein